MRQRLAIWAFLVLATLGATLVVNAGSVRAGTGDLTQLDYRWYENVDAQLPTTPLASENTAITGVADAQVLRLRINVDNASTNLAAGTTFKLQYGTSTSGPWTDVGGIGSGAIWRGYDNPTPADGDASSSNLLGSSSAPEKQTYEEENNATSPGIAKNKVGEWDWVVQDNGAAYSTIYYFRLVLGDSTALAGYTNYPQLTTSAAPSVTVTESAGSTDITEGGATDSYDVVLDAVPSGTVTITVSPDADVSVSDPTLTFTTGDWSTPQTVTVTAVNDAIVEGGHTGTITHSASGGGYDGVSIASVVASITDNDTASVTVTESSGSTDVTEGGATDTYDVVLDLEPSGTVTITVSPDADVSVSDTSLVFTTGDWSTPQTITVTAVDDAFNEGPHTGTITHSASGGSYDGVSISNVVANITDNDAPDVTVTESGGSTDVVEGGATDTYDVVLDAVPSGTVTITVSPDADVSVSDTSLVFTTGDWSTPQTVTVTAVNDAIVEGSHTGTISHSASGGGYDSVSISDVVANITDNDTASVTVTESSGSTDVVEGGATDTYDVVLDLEPSGTVTITVSPDADVSVSDPTLTFTTGDWSTPQTITVTAVNDAIVEGGHTGTITHSASGGSYDGVSIASVVANITDNDTASVTVTESSGSTDVVEGGATDTYDVVLDLEPSGTVTITVSPDADVSVSDPTLTFTTGDWSTPQTITVAAVNDAIVEGGHTGTITHSGSGGSYDGVSIASVVANITDNDTASVTVTESSGSTDVVEGGATDTYDVVLDLEPSGTVTITVSPDADVSVSDTSLVFTTGDWSTPQTITVTAVDDAFNEGPHTGTITHSASGGSYDGVSISNVVANITDNDAPDVTVTESGGSTDVVEGGATDTYDVVLDAVPSGTVTITVSPDADVSVSDTSLVFTTGDWSTPQTVTVTAVNDAIVEGSHTGTITHSASGGGYDSVSISDVVANVTDNDAASVTVTETSGSTDVVEGGATDTYDVVLDLEPSGTVTITVSPDADASVSDTSLVFTTGDWSTPQTITVTAVNDAIVEGSHTGTITHSASGGSYDGVSISNMVSNITDNDAPSVTVTETGGSTDVEEGGPTDTYDVVLDLEPSGTVTITVSPDADVSVSDTSLVFTTGDWSTPQTITVTAVDDSDIEFSHTGTITHSASGGSYTSVSIASVVANVTDDDAVPTLDQDSYRWYQNADGTQPGSSLAAEDTAASGVASSDVIRLRISLGATVLATSAGETFKLQYALSTGGPWTDVGGIGSGVIWRGYDNATPTDGSTLSVALLSGISILETYEEANSSAGIPNSITVGNSAEWDWVIENNGAAAAATYYFRMVYSDGSAVDTYTQHAQLSTATPVATLTQNDYRWYQNVDGLSPTTALSAENTAATGMTDTTVLRLRMNVSNGPVDLAAGAAFKLQYSTSTSGPWTDVGGLGSGQTWRGYDNATPADGAFLGGIKLSSSTVGDRQSYEEENSATTPATLNKNKTGEFDWVVQGNGVDPSTTYYFRMVFGNGTVLTGYTNYPQVTIGAAGVTVAPNNSNAATPETVLSYTHTITNTGAVTDTIDVTASSSAGWTVQLFESDGTTPLSDTDSDLVPDTGLLSHTGGSVDIVVKVTVGWNTTTDVTTVTATSSGEPLESDQATDTTTGSPTITLIITDSTAEFGSNMDPAGTASNSTDTVVAYSVDNGNQGAYYIWSSSGGSGVMVTVKSNLPWNGTTSATENSGSSSTMTVGSGVWRYAEGAQPSSYSECESSTAFTTNSSPWKTSIPAGINQYTQHYCLRVDWTDDPGDFLSTITYDVSQL